MSRKKQTKTADTAAVTLEGQAVLETLRSNMHSSAVRPAEVFRAAVIENAPSIVVSHNHPSGDPTPSPEDVKVTRDLVAAGKLLDIEVMDHIVIGNGRFVSLKEKGLMDK